LALFGKRYVGKTLESYETLDKSRSVCLSFCRTYADELDRYHANGIGIVLSGASGTGKTHLVCALGGRVLERGYGLEISRFHEIIREVRNECGVGEAYEQDIIDRYAAPDFLVIEDIGIPVNDHAATLVLYDIIDGRYRKTLPTIITTTMDRDEFSRYIDFDRSGRLPDRIAETSVFFRLEGGSYRSGTASD
jgi:DNA replication protein DnaC